MRTPLLVALLPLAATAFVAYPLARAAPAPEPPPPSDPVCVGWDGGWVVHRYSLAKGEWSSWKSPEAVLPRLTGFSAVGPHAAAVLDPDRKYSGWLFDLRSQKWAEIPVFPLAGPDVAWDRIVVAFAGGRLVLWGRSKGEINGATLDTRTMKWTPMPRAPISLRFRALHAAIGGKVVVWGGYSNALQDGAVFDTEKNAWENLPAAPRRFDSGMSCEVWRGRFVVFGGRPGPGRASRSGAIYDPNRKAWERIEEAPLDVGVSSACVVCGDRLFVWSGAATGVEVEGKGQPTEDGAVYDFRTRKWEKIPRAPIPPRQIPFAQAAGPRAVVWGGWLPGNSTNRFLRDGAIYDLDKKEWRKLPDLPGSVPVQIHPGW